MVEDLTGLLDALDVERAVVVGHDWGASVTYGVATHAPERVEKMVALGIPHPATLKPSPQLALFGRHFLWFALPWAATSARLGGMRMVDRLYRRWAPGWKGPERDAAVRAAGQAFEDPRVLEGALAYYQEQRPGASPLRGRIDVPALVVGGADEVALRPGYDATPSALHRPLRGARAARRRALAAPRGPGGVPRRCSWPS